MMSDMKYCMRILLEATMTSISSVYYEHCNEGTSLGTG
jgi:hypothetical protein